MFIYFFLSTQHGFQSFCCWASERPCPAARSSREDASASEPGLRALTVIMSTFTLQDEVVQAQDLGLDFRDGHANQWRILDTSKLTKSSDKMIAHRLNSFGSLFYFVKIVLKRKRLTESLHKVLCDLLESTHLKEVIEWPRDHFKSTICSEGAPMWWALPFSQEDEDWMRKLGYDDSWITWMHRAHDQNTRTLLISENITNAKKLGFRISQHYENNQFYRDLFKEVLPNEKCKWTEESMHHIRSKNAGPQGEGTYDFLGVGSALQSRHYDRIVPDDIFGIKGSESEAVREATIEYFKLIVGAMDSSAVNANIDNDEVIVGNRWAVNDLDAWIREHLPYYRFTNHSAEGGCCDLHPAGKPIFPEEYTIEKLLRWKMRLGIYKYSCQFLNNPLVPGSTRWAKSYINYFKFDLVNYKRDSAGKLADNRVKIIHDTKSGTTLHSIMPNQLVRTMIVDPNHSEKRGRCRHAIIIPGLFLDKKKTDDGKIEIHKRIYLLETWAESTLYGVLCDKICELIKKWKLEQIWIEGIAFQKFLKHHLDTIFPSRGIKCKVNTFKDDTSEDAKHNRIRGLDPIFESGQLYANHNDATFMGEYEKYPRGTTIDVLDTLGLYSQLIPEQGANKKEVDEFMERVNSNNPYKPTHNQGSSTGREAGRSRITGY